MSHELIICRDWAYSMTYFTKEKNFVADQFAHLGNALSLGCHVLIYFLYLFFCFLIFCEKRWNIIDKHNKLRRVECVGTQHVNGAYSWEPKNNLGPDHLRKWLDSIQTLKIQTLSHPKPNRDREWPSGP